MLGSAPEIRSDSWSVLESAILLEVMMESQRVTV
jgi:hypothetical protein